MAGIITNVGEDIKSLQQLRQEIENVKKALGSIDVNVKIDIRKELEQKLQALTKQYDVLVSKAAEADAKLMESANRIDKAVDIITAAQEKAAKVNAKQTTARMEEVQSAAVEGQAKAYLDLKEEIDSILGTREQNIRQMVREQNAIRLINAEIAQINNSRKYGGEFSSTQSKRLQQLNNNLLTHKQALAEVRQELNNNAKLDIAAAGSMNELSQSLYRMRIAYRALNEDERNSQFGQNLLKSIQEADIKIKELDSTIGNHQRNVGNYQGRFNGLNMSVQQVVRELPAARMGINMFFMAISNNLPIMADQIKYAQQFNKEMKAAGQEPIPVWKQLVSSLFSWQSAMMVGITLLTIYGKDIANWVKELFKANNAQEQARKEAEAFAKTVQKAHEGWRSSVAKTAAQQITEYRKMQREWNRLGNNLTAKKKYIDANKTAFHQLGFAVNGVSDAERVMAGNTDAVVQSIMARAKAAAYYAQMQEATERYIKQTEYNKSTIAGGGYYNRIKAGKTFLSTGVVPKELQGLKEGVHYTTTSSGTAVEFVLNALGAAEINSRRNQAAAKAFAENQKKAKDQLDNQISSLQDGLETVIKENQDLLKKIGISEYKDYEDKKEKQKKESVARQVDYDKMQREQSEAERNLENAVSQSRIDAMQEGYEKEKKQRKLNHKKELEDIDKQRNDFLRRKIDDAKRIFDSDPKNNGKKFDYSSVTLSAAEQGKFDEMRANTIKKHANEEREVQRARISSLNDYLKEYGTMQEQKAAIAAEYGKKIAKAQNEGEKAMLDAVRRKMLAGIDMKALQASIDWEDVFNDMDKHSTAYLEDIKKKLRAALDAKDITAENAKVLSEKIREIEDTIGGRTDIWSSMLPGLRERLRLAKETARAEEAAAKARGESISADLHVLQTKQDIQAKLKQAGVTAGIADITKESKDKLLTDVSKGSDIYDALLKLFENLATDTSRANVARENVGQAERRKASVLDKLGSLSKITDVIPWAAKGTSFGQIIESVNANVQSMSDLVDTIGLGNSEFGEAVHNFADGVGNFSGAISSLANGDVFGAVNGVVKGFQSFGRVLGIGGGNAERVTKSIDRLTERNELLGQSIDDLSDEMAKSRGAAAIKVSTDADKLLRERIENYKRIAQEQASYHSAHKSFNRYWEGYNDEQKRRLSEQIGRQWNGDIWNLSPEEMKVLRSNVDMWEKIEKTGKGGYGARVAEKLNDYIAQSGKLQENTEALYEILTTTTKDNIFDDFLDSLHNLADGSEDVFDKITDNWQHMVNKMVVNNLVGEKFQKNLEGWYNKLAELNRKRTKGEISDSKYKGSLDELKKDYDKYVRTAQNEIEQLRSAGIISHRASSEQNATANGISSITFEQATNIVALTTAGNISRDQIKDRLTLMNATMDDIRALMSQTSSPTPDYANDTRNIINNSYAPQIQVSFPKDELQDIKEKVGTLLGVVDEMRTHGVEGLLVQRQATDDIAAIAKNGTEIKSYVEDIRKSARDLSR